MTLLKNITRLFRSATEVEKRYPATRDDVVHEAVLVVAARGDLGARFG